MVIVVVVAVVMDEVGAKLAVSLIGPIILIVAAASVPVYESVPLPVHPVKTYPLFGAASIGTD